WEAQSGWNAGPASSAAWLQDRVLLRPERGARDVLRGFQGKPKLLSAAKEDLLLAPHRRRRDRQRLLHPLVVRQQIAMAEREEMSTIVGVPVASLVVCEDAGRRPRRVALVVICRAADP